MNGINLRKPVLKRFSLTRKKKLCHGLNMFSVGIYSTNFQHFHRFIYFYHRTLYNYSIFEIVFASGRAKLYSPEKFWKCHFSLLHNCICLPGTQHDILMILELWNISHLNDGYALYRIQMSVFLTVRTTSRAHGQGYIDCVWLTPMRFWVRTAQ
jgi:hypothetical protein